MTNALNIIKVTGEDIRPYFNDLASLRLTVFREFPYLYEGTIEYEKTYLNTYISCPTSHVFLALDGNKVVGATTTIPLIHEDDAMKTPFLNGKFPLNEVIYFGESMLLPEYRGHGTGHRFFEVREKIAREMGFTYSAFAAIDRPENHPHRPSEWKPLHEFWQQQGYKKHPELVCYFSWKDVDETSPTKKPLTFWIKKL